MRTILRRFIVWSIDKFWEKVPVNDANKGK